MYSNPFRQLYKESGKTIEALAFELNMSIGTIERIAGERGPAENLNMRTLRRYLAYFNRRLVIVAEPLNGGEASDATT